MDEMFYKYYTADLMVFGKNKLQTPSITVKVFAFTNPLTVVDMMHNQLKAWDMDGHKTFNLRRIK